VLGIVKCRQDEMAERGNSLNDEPAQENPKDEDKHA
jgi:hypothetical protein